jgi:hypothetical protein
LSVCAYITADRRTIDTESTGIQTARMLLAGIKPIDTLIDDVFFMSMTKPTRVQLLNEFESAPNSTLFNQNTIAAVLNCSTQLLERNRWARAGILYIKIGRKVLYRKSTMGQGLKFATKLINDGNAKYKPCPL